MSAGSRGASFSLRVFRIFTLTLLFVACTVVLPLVRHERTLIREDLIEKGRTLAGVLSRSARTAVFSENRALLAEAAQGLLEKDYVLGIAVFDVLRRPLFAERKGAQPEGGAVEALSPAAQEAVTSLGIAGGFEVVEEPRSFDVFSSVAIRPVQPGGAELYFDLKETTPAEEVIGWVRVSLDKESLRRDTLDMVARVGLTILAFLAIGSFLTLLVARRAVRPLALLSEEVRAVGRGEAVARVSVSSRDEVGQLAESFNAMLDDLAARERNRSALEERLRESQKLEAVGTLARGISHDFNNILSTVKGAVHILEKRHADDEFLLRYTEKIRTALQRAGELIGGLIAFSRTRQPQTRSLELNGLVTSLAGTIRDLLGETIHLEVSLSPEPLHVLGDPLGLNQVLMNLAANARDSMPHGGILTIATSGCDQAGGGGSSFPDACWAGISVTDTGTGMDSATRERIFEPFYTTKEVGRGTGLGLAIVHGIVEQHHGRIRVQSAVGQGTTFQIVLPLSAGGSAAAEEQQ